MLTDYVLLDIILILPSVLAALYLWMKKKHTYWEKRGVRSLPGHWFFGHFKDAILMRKSPGIVIGELYRQATNEDILGIYIFYKPFLLVRNPELIKQILIRDFHVFPNRHFTAQSNIDRVGSSSLFTIDNPEWKYLRTKMSPVFTSGKMKSLFLLMLESADSMKTHLRDEFAHNSDTVASFNIKNILYKYTTDVISSMAFGIRTDCFDKPAPKFYEFSRKAFQQTFGRAFKFFIMFFFPTIGKYMGQSILGDYTDYFRKVFWDSMDSRSVTKMKRGDLIDSLLELKTENKPDDTFQMEGDILLAQAVIFFVAGRETSITTITYTLCELARHPEIQKRVRQEILEKIQATDGVTYEAVQNMKYLHQVVSETMRLYPPAPILDRVPIKDYTFPDTNISIEKGTPIYIALYGLHNDLRYHPDPTRFDPERFSDEKKSEIAPCTFMPFGEGPRNCIGMRLGILQTAVGLITILRDYEIELNPSWMCTIDRKNVFITPPDGFMLNLKRI